MREGLEKRMARCGLRQHCGGGGVGGWVAEMGKASASSSVVRKGRCALTTRQGAREQPVGHMLEIGVQVDVFKGLSGIISEFNASKNRFLRSVLTEV